MPAPTSLGSGTLTLQNITYTYADNGNILDLSDSPESTGTGRLATLTQHYEYDDLDQLTLARGTYNAVSSRSGSLWGADTDRVYTAQYAYDKLGRMTHNEVSDQLTHSGVFGRSRTSRTVTHRVLDYTYPLVPSAEHPLHAPASITDAASAASTFNRINSYDRNGNLLGYGSGSGPASVSRAIAWDDENRVRSIQDTAGPGSTTSFIYDASGNRTHKVNGTATTLYPNAFVAVRRLRGARWSVDNMTNHIYAGQARIASDVVIGSSRTPYWYHGDHLSSTNYMTTGNGDIAEHVEYMPFGEPWFEEAGSRAEARTAVAEQFLFTSKELDTETGLYYFGARYLDPQVGMWISADPILATYVAGSPNGGVFNPRNLEMYSYSQNSPIWLFDPSGRDVWMFPIEPIDRHVTDPPPDDPGAAAETHFDFRSGTGSASQSSRSSDRRLLIEYTIRLQPPQIRYNPATPPGHRDRIGLPDAVHEGIHERAFRNFYTHDVLTPLAVRAGLPMTLPAGEVIPATLDAQRRGREFGRFAEGVGNYLSAIVLHTRTGDPIPSIPTYHDPVDGHDYTPTDQDLDPTYQQVRQGIPGAPEHLPGFRPPAAPTPAAAPPSAAGPRHE